MKSYKIALVVDHFLPRVGGIELHVADLARQLAAAGHLPQVLTTTPGASEIDGLTIHRLGGPLLPGFQILCHRRPLDRLQELLDREQFDVVHSHSSIISPLAYAAGYIARRQGIPGVLTSHSLMGPHRPMMHAAHGCLGWTRWPKRLTAVSRVTANMLASLSGRADVGVLFNGINVSQWQPAPSEPHELRVTTVSRLNIKKRVQDLLRAIPQIKASLPNGVRPRFTVVGDGPYRGRLERLVDQLAIRDDVEFLGYQSRASIKEIFRRTDVFALPSVFEAFGLAVLEARCARLPVVAMSGCGVSDIIEHGRHGLLAENRQQLAEHIVRLLTDAPLREQMSLEAGRGLDKFDWPHVIQQHIDVYAGLGNAAEQPRERKAG